jgi:hypothetical protein
MFHGSHYFVSLLRTAVSLKQIANSLNEEVDRVFNHRTGLKLAAARA